MAHELSSEASRVNRKRVQRLMRTMGIAALYPRKSTSTPGVGHRVYPYLLRGQSIDRANQVWCSHPGSPGERGFMYLVAIMDWYSRYVLSWRLSNTLDAEFCVSALEEALRRGKPEIFNTDQGSQFTSREFTGVLQENQIAISMDGRGRTLDPGAPGFIERLLWSVKYEEVYLKAYGTVADLNEGLARYFDFYDHRRKHQALDHRTPYEVFQASLASTTQRRRREPKYQLASAILN